MKRSWEESRFWVKVQRTNGCWLWIASLDAYGYGQFRVQGRTRKSHQLAYELLVGPVPRGLELDHLCRNPRCVNPAHLEPVTHRDNILRGTAPIAINSQKTHCHMGHPFDDQNTVYYVAGSRQCRECNNRRSRESQRRQRAAQKARMDRIQR